MKAMVKPNTLRAAFVGLLLTTALIGCKDPTSHPLTAPPLNRDGVTLNTEIDHISPDPQGRPYIVSTDWVVPAGRTVTIDPGTEIMFDGLRWVDVQGQIVARGTVAEPIIFTSSRLSPDMGQWRGFKLRDKASSEPQSVFEHCVFSYGGYFEADTTKRDPVDTTLYEARSFAGLVCVRNSSPVIERCVAVFNQNNAVFISGPNARPTVKYNIFTRNDASGIRGDLLLGDLSQLNGLIAYNNASDNSSKPFLFLSNDSLYGKKVTRNLNLDSCDQFFNLVDLPPLMLFQSADRYYKPPVWNHNGQDFALESCSPCVDAGPTGTDLDPDQSRADMGTMPYVHGQGELRGVISGTLDAGISYRMSCDVKIDSNSTLTIPAGTQITVTGYYRMDVEGQLIIGGTPSSHVSFVLSSDTSLTHADIWAGLRFSRQYPLVPPSSLHYTDFTKIQHIDVLKKGIEFVGCSFDQAYDYGMLVATGATDMADTVSIRNCTFTHCGAAGITVDTCSVTIRNTQVIGTPGRGIALIGTGENAELTNNVIRSGGGIGLVLAHGANPVVVNNTVAWNAYHGIYMEDNCRPLMLNNIVCRNQRYGIWDSLSCFARADDYGDVFGHFLVSGRDTTFYDYHGQNGHAGEFSISRDPAFVSATDLHLQAGSPCVNAGDSRPEYNDPDGNRNDMGAYGGPGAASGVGASHYRSNSGRLASK
jgi:parallel beta-helix repeat protein